ncbi:MAG: galactose oxidase [Verrucomicrobia bacterium]|nr:galactose oxidase [Verrucomicrobiota bacterium]
MSHIKTVCVIAKSPNPAIHVRRSLTVLASLIWLLGVTADAQVPALINYQGRIAVGRDDFDGQGQFKLALVNASGSEVYWLNHADANGDGEPDQPLSLTVSRGLFSVQLGDTSLPNMAPLSLAVFNNNAVYLRVWFNDGSKGFERLVPDQRVASVGYAIMAAGVPDGAITPEKLAPRALEVLTALSNRLNAIETLIPSGLTLASPDAASDALISKGFQPFTTIAPFGWVSGSPTGAASPRHTHSAVWTGQELIVWGGIPGPGLFSGSGAVYHPGLNQWSSISSDGAPSARAGHSAIWTGQDMIVWGGFSPDGYLRTGARFNSSSQDWLPTSVTGAPISRDGHSAVWTGSRMLIWGGRNADGPLGDFFLYDPAADQWSPVSVAGGPSARFGSTMIWTGNSAVIWGGEGSGGVLGSGARLLFSSNGTPSEWLSVSTANAPSSRSEHTAVWTGQRMIVWGGQSSGELLGDGASYDPVSNTWEPLPALDAPAPRRAHSAVWTGQEMIILGGETSFGFAASGSAFNPASGKWRPLSTTGNPQPRAGATAAWTGTELLVFGGRTGSQPVGSCSVVADNLAGAATSDPASLALVLPRIPSANSPALSQMITLGDGTFDGGSTTPSEGRALALESLTSASGPSWFAWKAPSSGIAAFNTNGIDFDTVLSMQTGNPSSLVEMAKDDDRGGFLTSEVTVNVTQTTAV